MKGRYKRKFPVDEFGSPSNRYSPADTTIHKFQTLTRDCVVIAQDLQAELYEVKDTKKGWTFVLAFKEVVLLTKLLEEDTDV